MTGHEKDPLLGPEQDPLLGPAETSAPAKPAPGSAWDTVKDFGVGAGEGASLGFDDETVGALHAVAHAMGLSDKTYTQARDEWRARQDLAHERSPVAAGAGQVSGALALGAVTGGAGAEASLAREALVMGGTGAAAGLGSSRAQDAAGLARDTAIGAGTGLVTGQTVRSLGRATQTVVPRVAQAAERTRVSSVGLGPKAESMGDAGPVAEALDRHGITRGVPGPAVMQERIRARIPEQQARLRANDLPGRMSRNQVEKDRLLGLARAAEQAPLEQTQPSAPKASIPPASPTVPNGGTPTAPSPAPPGAQQGPPPDLNADIPTLRPPGPAIGPAGTPLPKLRPRPPLPGKLAPQGPPPDLNSDLPTLRPPGPERVYGQITGTEQTMPALPKTAPAQPVTPAVSQIPAQPRPMGAQRQAIPTDSVARALRERAGQIPTQPSPGEQAVHDALTYDQNVLGAAGGHTDPSTGRLVGGSLEHMMQNGSGTPGPELSHRTPGAVLRAANAVSGGRGLSAKASIQEGTGHALSGMGRALSWAAPATAQEAAIQAVDHYKNMTDPAYRNTYIED